MNWSHIGKKQPQIGQRLLVWDRQYSEVVIAYYNQDGGFKEWSNGKGRRVIAEWWMSLPEIPHNENKQR